MGVRRVVDTLPKGDGWIYEEKLDGYRAVLLKNCEHVRIRSRQNKDVTHAYPSVVASGDRQRTFRAWFRQPEGLTGSTELDLRPAAKAPPAIRLIYGDRPRRIACGAGGFFCVAAIAHQRILPFGAVRNSELFSSHWLDQRLPLEPEFPELRTAAEDVLNRLAELWKVQRTRVEHYGAEQQLEQAFIQPAVQTLGWHLLYQVHLRGRDPDYALFLDASSVDRALDAGRRDVNFWEHPTLVADAKAWHISLDRPQTMNNRREYPPEQIEWYLDKSRLSYGVLTNGRVWRLIPRELDSEQRRFQTYLECDLPMLLDGWLSEGNMLRRDAILDEFVLFYLFFGPAGYIESERPSLILRARRGSSEYRLGIGEDLKARVFEALRLCIDGFLHGPSNELDPGRDLVEIRAQSFVLLYRLLFILYAEDRQLLPYRKNRLYTENRSLGRWRQDVAVRLDAIEKGRADDYSKAATELWDDLIGLFDLIDSGNGRYDVPAYNGGLFDDDQHQFLRAKRLPDWHLARVIDQLSRAKDETQPEGGLFSVDYRDLRIQHLGSIYEGLLELHPHLSPHHELNEVTGETIPPGHVYLRTLKGERRTTGSYYTPNPVVDYIVANTIGPLCRQISHELQTEIADAWSALGSASSEDRPLIEERVRQLQGDFDDRVLRLRILDPSMGSGHFLISACQYLAEEIATHPHARHPKADELREDSTLVFWKRQVVEHCLYGVDLNPLAVELAKLALWLETLSTEQPLTYLDHHLRHGDSLVGAFVQQLRCLPGSTTLLRDTFTAEISDKVSTFLDPLQQIAAIPSDTTDQVKQKSRLLRVVSERVKPFYIVADLWCSTFYLPREFQPTHEQYQEVASLVGHPIRLTRLMQEPWLEHALKVAGGSSTSFFHWELEFPEAFFSGASRRPDAGFDAVIGNPPYDVLSELENPGHDLTGFRRFIDALPVYAPSVRGKNNLYKLFICRALELLADGGLLGFITPMAVLGDDQSADLRRAMVGVGAFRSVDAFPQKDSVEKRVFREAKLSTAVFTLQKTTNKELRGLPFVARTHPGAEVEEDSPRLSLSTAEMPLYDPKNLTLVSASQADWDLVTRMIGSNRMVRLGEFVEFFQGEVNETNERKRGTFAPPGSGKLVTRGAAICLYVAREASQGNDIWLDVEKFLAGRGPDTKAFHHRHDRVGVQETSPQNNFRRVIGAFIPAGNFCNHKVNYTPGHMSTISLRLVLAVLNSQLTDWYFRLGSTNAAVSHYQLYNLPCPRFHDGYRAGERELSAAALQLLAAGDPDAAERKLRPFAGQPPFGRSVRDLLESAVDRIIQLETQRGAISRAQRSKLGDAAQPTQVMIDRLFFAMAGFSTDEAAALEERLARML